MLPVEPIHQGAGGQVLEEPLDCLLCDLPTGGVGFMPAAVLAEGIGEEWFGTERFALVTPVFEASFQSFSQSIGLSLCPADQHAGHEPPT